MADPAGPLLGGIQWGETLSGHLQGMATSSVITQNPAGGEPAATTVPDRAVPCVLTVRGWFASIPNVRAQKGTVLACTQREIGPNNYWCHDADIISTPVKNISGATSYWKVDATYILIPLT
jgi:hypothetical protein